MVTDEAIISAVLSSPDNKQAAEMCGLSESQFYRRLATPSCDRLYQRAKRVLYEGALSILERSLTSALLTMDEIAQNPEVAPSTRLNACREIVNTICRFTAPGGVVEQERDRNQYATLFSSYLMKKEFVTGQSIYGYSDPEIDKLLDEVEDDPAFIPPGQAGAEDSAKIAERIRAAAAENPRLID